MALIVPPSVLIQVALKMLSGYGVVDAIDATLYQRPKALNGVGVDVPADVHLFRVPDAVVK